MLRIAACFFGGLIVLVVSGSPGLAIGATMGFLIGLGLAMWLTADN